MTTVTTRAQQAKIGAAARKVGGYRTLINLSEKKRDAERKGASVKIGKDASGDWAVVKAKPSRKGVVMTKKSGKATTRFIKADR